jgi:integrase
MELQEFYNPEMPKIPPSMRDILSGQKLTKYFEAVAVLEEPVRTAALLLPCSGLRSNEMVGLRLDGLHTADLKLKNGKKKKVLMLRVIGKGRRERSVPLLDEGKLAVQQYLSGWRRSDPDPTWFFPQGKKHIANRTLRAALQRVREPLGMKFTPHTMRRTYFTELYRRGVEPVTLAKIAGHANINTLVNHYLAIDDHDVGLAVHNAGSRLIN